MEKVSLRELEEMYFNKTFLVGEDQKMQISQTNTLEKGLGCQSSFYYSA